MSTESVVEPEEWAVLALPPSDVDRVAELVAILEELRIPGAVRHSRFDGDGTFAIVPVSGGGDVCAVRQGYHPVIGWDPVDRAELAERFAQTFGRGSTLNGFLLNGDDDIDSLVGVRHVDAIAWTTRDSRDTTALLAAKHRMTLLALIGGSRRTVLSPQDPADLDRAFAESVWLAPRALVVWRSGSESGAAILTGFTVRQIMWRSPWVQIDPSRPGQHLETGVSLRAAIDDAIAQDDDVDAWIKAAGVTDGRASLLRALVRREPTEGSLGELVDLLGVDRSVLDLLDGRERVPGVEIIEPRGFRQQTAEEFRRDVGMVPAREDAWARRHPLLWFGAWGIATVALGAFATVGLAEGRASAWLPMAGAAVCALRLVVYATLTRVRRRAESESRTVGRG
ncbi:hypothetical protein [Microbacterium sp. NPDC089695]|uniref:hypothetical protein n=1 Tax=Microbacterium sp. NPDC089695 TaxID=3364198 RepID=UPI0037F448D5